MLTRPTINVSSENFHHVFFRVTGDADLGAVSVGGDVELFVIVEEAEDVGGGWGCGRRVSWGLLGVLLVTMLAYH